MAHDTIEVLKVLFQKKALINGKSEYKTKFWQIFEEELFICPLDQNFAVLTEMFQPVTNQ